MSLQLARLHIECGHEGKTRWEGGVINKLALEDSTAVLEIQQGACKSCSPYQGAIFYCSKLTEVPFPSCPSHTLCVCSVRFSPGLFQRALYTFGGSNPCFYLKTNNVSFGSTSDPMYF